MSELVKAALAAAEGITVEEAFDTFVERVTQQRPDPVVVIPHSIPDAPEPMLYREWDMDGDVVTEYERQGECLRCGECCRHKIEAAYTEGKGNPGFHGVWLEASRNGSYFYVQITSIDPERTFDEDCPCAKLTEDNLCSMHGEDRGYKDLCQRWPLAPRCLEHFPGCGYSFVEVGKETISGAYPSTCAILQGWWEKEATEENEKVAVT